MKEPDARHEADLSGDRNHHQARLHQFQKQECMGLMAGAIAHDFNNLLLGIMGNADLMDRELPEECSARPLLDEIRKAADRAADMCNQLLTYAGKGQLDLQTVDLSSLVQEMVQMLRVAISRKITLRLNLRDNLPPLKADPSQVQQVVMNLVVNASEAIGHERKGVICLTTDRLPCPPQDFHQCFQDESLVPGDYISLEVSDTGAGMDTGTLQRAFDPFFSTKLHGRGLGLSSVLGIAKGHQGAVCVKSEPGSGSTFRVCFPVDHQGTCLEAAGRRISSHEGRGQGVILVIDDEEYLRILCTRMLKRLGYEVLQAADGPQALEIYQERGPEIDCVMLDLIMPIMDGSEVLDKLLELDPRARVVMTSGYHQREISRRFYGRGIAGFLQKPYILADLSEVLNEALSRPD